MDAKNDSVAVTGVTDFGGAAEPETDQKPSTEE